MKHPLTVLILARTRSLRILHFSVQLRVTLSSLIVTMNGANNKFLDPHDRYHEDGLPRVITARFNKRTSRANRMSTKVLPASCAFQGRCGLASNQKRKDFSNLKLRNQNDYQVLILINFELPLRAARAPPAHLFSNLSWKNITTKMVERGAQGKVARVRA